MSDMKCPFCEEELQGDTMGEYGCPNARCKKSAFMFGAKELWQALIDTNQKLDIAIKALNEIKSNDDTWEGYINRMLKQIGGLNNDVLHHN